LTVAPARELDKSATKSTISAKSGRANKDAMIQGPDKIYDPISAHDYLQQRIAANFAQ
jgi:hypothetical protein